MSARSRNAVWRIACFLHWVGIQPSIQAGNYRRKYQFLMDQYCALPLSLRREARRRGRQAIREFGLKGAASDLFPAAVFASRGKKNARAQQLAELLSRSPDRCSTCRSSWGPRRHKRCWSSQEDAEAFRMLTDSTLSVYPCPARTESLQFHLGHRKPDPNKNRSLILFSHPR
jgi:hypothetical protein